MNQFSAPSYIFPFAFSMALSNLSLSSLSLNTCIHPLPKYGYSRACPSAYALSSMSSAFGS